MTCSSYRPSGIPLGIEISLFVSCINGPKKIGNVDKKYFGLFLWFKNVFMHVLCLLGVGRVEKL